MHCLIPNERLPRLSHLHTVPMPLLASMNASVSIDATCPGVNTRDCACVQMDEAIHPLGRPPAARAVGSQTRGAGRRFRGDSDSFLLEALVDRFAVGVSRSELPRLRERID